MQHCIEWDEWDIKSDIRKIFYFGYFEEIRSTKPHQVHLSWVYSLFYNNQALLRGFSNWRQIWISIAMASICNYPQLFIPHQSDLQSSHMKPFEPTTLQFHVAPPPSSLRSLAKNGQLEERGGGSKATNRQKRWRYGAHLLTVTSEDGFKSKGWQFGNVGEVWSGSWAQSTVGVGFA